MARLKSILDKSTLVDSPDTFFRSLGAHQENIESRLAELSLEEKKRFYKLCKSMPWKVSIKGLLSVSAEITKLLGLIRDPLLEMHLVPSLKGVYGLRHLFNVLFNSTVVGAVTNEFWTEVIFSEGLMKIFRDDISKEMTEWSSEQTDLLRSKLDLLYDELAFHEDIKKNSIDSILDEIKTAIRNELIVSPILSNFLDYELELCLVNKKDFNSICGYRQVLCATLLTTRYNFN